VSASSIKPVQRRGVSILNHPSSQPPAERVAKPSGLTITEQTSPARELAPLPVVHLDPKESESPQNLAKQFVDSYEAIRKATLHTRQDPGAFPCYVRGVQFKNTSNAVANVSVTFQHTLGRQNTGLHPCRSQGAAFYGYEMANPQGQDPTKWITVTTAVPANTTATHDFRIFGD
jgi:hypothetical protein